MVNKLLLKFKNLSFRKKIIYIFLPLITIPLILLAILTSRIVIGATVKQAQENSKDKLLLISRQVNLIIDDIEHNIIILSTNKVLQDALIQERDEDILGDIQYRAVIAPTFSNIMNISEYVDQSRIVNSEGRIYDTQTDKVTHESGIAETEEYKYAANSIGRLIWRDTHEREQLAKVNNASILNLTKLVIDIPSGNYIGAISINIKQDAISNAFSNIKNGKTGEFFVVNEDGIIVSSLEKSRLFSSIAEEDYFKWIKKHENSTKNFDIHGESTLVTTTPVLSDIGLKWYVVSTVPIAELTEEYDKIILNIIIIGFACLVVTVMLSHFLASSITKPVLRLIKFTKLVSEGDLDTEIKIEAEDEIGTLAQHFNIMVKSIRDLILKNYIEQKKKREYELSLLQSQVNPHFLYNTIENIRSLTLSGDNLGAYEVATNLGGFYKGVLSKGRDIITIEEEITLIVNYIKIQKFRLEDLFNYTIDIDEAILKSSILKLTLQPLIENSIIHGLRGFKKNGTISITGRLDKDKVFLEVFDDGRGIKKEVLEKVFSKETKGINKVNFGLKNIDERIKLQFGEAFGISVECPYSEGTKIIVTLPFIYNGG